MRLIGALSISRAKLLEFQADAFKKLMVGALTTAKLAGIPKAQNALNSYIVKAMGILPKNDSVLAWLQETEGDVIGLMIFQVAPGNWKFVLAAGTQAELRQIGESYNG